VKKPFFLNFFRVVSLHNLSSPSTQLPFSFSLSLSLSLSLSII